MADVEVDRLVALDSNFLVAVRNAASKSAAQLEQWLRQAWTVRVSAVAWSEYLCGPLSADEITITRNFISSVDPFTEDDAELAGQLFNRTGRRPRSHADCMIAAHAIRRRARLATLNVKDFQRFEKFQLRLG